MKKNGRTLREDVRIIGRGLREFDRILPGQMRRLNARSLLSSLTPYIAVILSAMLLNELAGAQDQARIAAYILVSTGATLLISCAVYFLDARIAVGYARLFSTHDILLTDKAYRLPFALLEKESTRSLREQVSGSIHLSGAGMASLYWDMEVVAKNLCSTVIALVLVGRFAGQITTAMKSGLIGASATTGILVLLGVLIAGCAYFTCKISSKRFDVSYDVFEQGAKYNRYGEFYTLRYLPDENMAMDVRIFDQKKLILKESQTRCYQVLAQGKIKEMRANGRLDVAKAVCGGICGAAVYGIVGFLAIRNAIGIGNVVMMYAAVTMLIAALSDLAMIFTDLRNNNVHLLNYFRFMDLEEESEGDAAADPTVSASTPTESNDAADRAAGILFQHVSFRYPDSEALVLQDVTLHIAPGEKLAIVGENGSGKTTLIKLLCRLYRPTAGRILLDGRDIWDYPYDAYIRHLASVFQDFSLFAFSIAENVAATDSYDPQRVYDALCRADLKRKIDRLSKGIRQAISHDYEEDGMDLSGGEAQKVAIARAIYKAAPVVILDEPTAALDPYAEKEIYEQFFRNLSGETMLSISHRLSSCRLCDRIAVLDGGRLVQVGSHEALLAQKGGKYAQLWTAQAQYYADGAAAGAD